MFIQWMKFHSIKSGKVKSEEGFTLVEVIMVFVIMSIFSTTIVLPFLSNLNNGTRADIYATAAHIGARDIEDWRGSGFGNFPMSGTGSTGNDIEINGRTYVRTFINNRVSSSYTDVTNTAVTYIDNALGSYIRVKATVTEYSSDPDVQVTMYGLISRNYN